MEKSDCKKSADELRSKIKEKAEERRSVINEQNAKSEKATRESILKNTSQLLEHAQAQFKETEPLRQSMQQALAGFAAANEMQMEKLRLQNELLRRRLANDKNIMDG